MLNRLIMFLTALVISLCAMPGTARSDTESSSTVHEWAFERVSMWSPPGKSVYPGAEESEEDAVDRYRSIVDDAMAVAYDPSEPPLFANDVYGRAKTLAVMLSIADSESGFRKDVDTGVGPLSRGDGGRSWCLMQILLSKPKQDGRTQSRVSLKGDVYDRHFDGKTGLGGEDLVTDRKACFRVALHMARESFRACRSLPVDERLSVYAGGDCKVGRGASRVRVGKAIRWLAKKAPPRTDAQVLEKGDGQLAQLL